MLAAGLIEDGTYDKLLEERYAGWTAPDAQAMLSGKKSLEQIASDTEQRAMNPQPRSGQQERLENLLARNLF